MKKANKRIAGFQESAPEKAVAAVLDSGECQPPAAPAALTTRELTKTRTKITKTPRRGIVVEITASLDHLLANLCASTGTRHDEVAFRIVEQVGNSLHGGNPKDLDALLIRAISTIKEFEPQNLTEAMLAAQTIATHEAALTFLRRSTIDGQTVEGADANVLRAMRLMRLHLDQIEAMQKLKGKTGQQKVTVEHVHVYQGGQAIVGAVNAAKADQGEGASEEACTNTP